MATNNISQKPPSLYAPVDLYGVPSSSADPTDESAVDNVSVDVLDSYGGPHSTFDSNHYKAQARFPGTVLEFHAAQGMIIGHGYTWAISMIAHNDDLTTEIVKLPPADRAQKAFLDKQMNYFLTTYKPRILYLVSSNRDIQASDFDGTY